MLIEMSRTIKWKKLKKILLHVDPDPNRTLHSSGIVGTVNCINAYSLAVAVEDDVFYKALVESDILLCDGIFIQILCKLFLNKNVKRTTGPQFADFLFDYCANLGGKKILYYGSTASVCCQLETSLNNRGSSNCVIAKPGLEFRELDQNLISSVLAELTALKPELIFLGMTAPKQEKLALSLRENLTVMGLVQVGAYFDFTAGTVKRCPRFFSFLGIEWVWRLLVQPKKILYRIWYLRKLI